MVMPRATEQADERKGVDEVQLPRRLQSADELMTRRARHRRPSLKKCHMLPSVTRTLSLSRDPFSCQRIREHSYKSGNGVPRKLCHPRGSLYASKLCPRSRWQWVFSCLTPADYPVVNRFS